MLHFWIGTFLVSLGSLIYAVTIAAFDYDALTETTVVAIGSLILSVVIALRRLATLFIEIAEKYAEAKLRDLDLRLNEGESNDDNPHTSD